MRRRHIGVVSVSRLAIVAHGDQDGLVQLDRRLTPGSIQEFAPDLRRLGAYLETHASVEFYACSAGGGLAGDLLLERVSAVIEPRTVIGFEIDGETGQTAMPNVAGRVVEAPHGAGSGRPGVYLNPWHYAAKWAQRGHIIREAQFQRDAQLRCGNPNCRGHANSLQHCEGWPENQPPRH